MAQPSYLVYSGLRTTVGVEMTAGARGGKGAVGAWYIVSRTKYEPDSGQLITQIRFAVNDKVEFTRLVKPVYQDTHQYFRAWVT
jgi:hypothetical protein